MVFLVVMGVAGYYVYDKTFGVLRDIRTVNVEPTKVGGQPLPPLLTQPFNVLLIGVDLRQDRLEDGARSDTLIVVHVDPQAKTAAMLSVPRDSFAEMIGPDEQAIQSGKINAAFSYGYDHPELYAANSDRLVSGGLMARKNVEHFLGIDIPYYAEVNFQGFQSLIDHIGGLTIDVPHAILDAEYPTDDEGYMRLYIPPGLQHMDGVTALRYARTRHADNDFGRGQRQQQVLQGIVSSLKQRGLLAKLDALPAIAETIRSSVHTNLPIDTVTNLRGLASLAQELGTDRIAHYVLEPGTADDPHISGDLRSDIHWLPEYITEVAAQFEHGHDAAPAQPETAKIQVWNGKGVKGLGHSVTVDLQLAGLNTVDPTDAPTSANPHTLILDYTGKPATSQRLATMFHIKAQYVKNLTAQKAEAPFGVDVVLLVGDDYQEPQTVQGMSKK